MDLEETVKELKADLRNARELITCLTETVNSQRAGRDDDLNRKLDDILTIKASQKELEQKIGAIRDDTNIIAQDVKKSKEIANILDTVQTILGYSELFVKDFQKILTNQQHIQSQIELNSAEGETKMDLSQIYRRMDKMEELFVTKVADIKLDMKNEFQKHSQTNTHMEGRLAQMENKLSNAIGEIVQNMKEELLKLSPKSPHMTGIADRSIKDGEEQKLKNNSLFFGTGLFKKAKPEVANEREATPQNKAPHFTPEAYNERFGKDFDKIRAKTDELKESMDLNFKNMETNTLQVLYQYHEETEEMKRSFEQKLESIKQYMVNLSQFNSNKSAEIEAKVDDIGKKIKGLSQSKKPETGVELKQKESRVEVKKVTTPKPLKPAIEKPTPLSRRMLEEIDESWQNFERAAVFKCRNCISNLPSKHSKGRCQRKMSATQVWLHKHNEEAKRRTQVDERSVWSFM